MKLLISTILLSFFLFSTHAFSSYKVKCGDCTLENPCATVFSFKDLLKFQHKVYCWVDSDGDEHWDSNDYEKLERYDYFPIPPREEYQPRLKIQF